MPGKRLNSAKPRCPQVHRRDTSRAPSAGGPCGQRGPRPAEDLTPKTVASLRPLRYRLTGFVRGLHRYYEAVRLPVLVHRRRMSLDFPTRPAIPSTADEHRTSRFSCEVLAYVHGVSDRAGLDRISRYRCARWSLPFLLTTSASRRKELSRLNIRPARTPVNASTLSLRGAPHDSGPLWVAKPSAYDSFIHNTSPVYPGARGATEQKTHLSPIKELRNAEIPVATTILQLMRESALAPHFKYRLLLALVHADSSSSSA